MPTYLIAGASGQLGQLATDHLAGLVAPSDIIALVRSDEQEANFKAKGIATRRGDYTDPASLEAAFAGVDRLLLISSSDLANRVPQHKNVVAAAVSAGVGYIAYTSILNASDNPMLLAGDHKATEAMIVDSGIAHTFLRNGWYSENALMTLAQDLEMGQRFGASADGKYSFAARSDYAEAAAIVLAGGHDGSILELAGDEAITMTDYAAILADVSGKPVAYVDMPEDALAEAMSGAGLPGPLATILANSEACAAKGALFDSSSTLSSLIGHPTRPMRDTLQTALAN